MRTPETVWVREILLSGGSWKPVFLILDAYVDEPASLGVPPYISQYPRYLRGALRSLEQDVRYATIDQYRRGEVELDAEYVVVTGGAIVPGRYMRGLPASMKELREIALHAKGTTILGGPVARFSKEADAMGYDYVAKLDTEASVHDLVEKGRFTQRKRTYEEWLEWSVKGTDIVREHPDFPHYLIAEIESFRGCPRYFTGGCSFCIEPMYGRPAFRPPENIISEIKEMYDAGLRNFRIGAQTDIYSYMAEGIGKYEAPEPDIEALEELFSGIWECCPDIEVLHLDNANPATIAKNPEASEKATEILVKHTTSGNVLAFGMESADPAVIEANNLNTDPKEVMFAIEMLNRAGGERGNNGLPKLLPGLNFLGGLKGETKKTYRMNYEFLKEVLDRGLMLRRINIRQVAPIRTEFPRILYRDFMHFKNKVRREIDRPMLERLLPKGTVLRNVYLELNRGGVTYGRQIGSYPLAVQLPYPAETERFVDVLITHHSERSVGGVEVPLDINRAPVRAIQELPGIGKRRASRIVAGRPYGTEEEFMRILEDEVPGILKHIRF